MLNWLAFLVAIIGFFTWLLSKDAKFQEIGKIMLWTGLLAFLLSDGAWLNTLNIFRK